MAGAGGRRSGRVPWAWAIAAVVAVSLVAAAAAVLWQRRQAEAVATAQEWSIPGEPCPTLTAAEFAAKPYRLRMSFDFNGVRFARAAGHADCASIADKGGKGLGEFPVCQFTSPAVVRVTTGGGDVYFAPGVGQPATVSVPRGVPACVLNANFTLN